MKSYTIKTGGILILLDKVRNLIPNFKKKSGSIESDTDVLSQIDVEVMNQREDSTKTSKVDLSDHLSENDNDPDESAELKDSIQQKPQKNLRKNIVYAIFILGLGVTLFLPNSKKEREVPQDVSPKVKVSNAGDASDEVSDNVSDEVSDETPLEDSPESVAVESSQGDSADEVSPNEELATEESVAEISAPETLPSEVPPSEEPNPEALPSEVPPSEEPNPETLPSEVPPSEEPNLETLPSEVPPSEEPNPEAQAIEKLQNDQLAQDEIPLEVLPEEVREKKDPVENLSLDTMTNEQVVSGGENQENIDDVFTEQVLQDLEQQAKESVPKQIQSQYEEPPSYEYIGRGLVYNCIGKHWACVDAPSFKKCEDNFSYLKNTGGKTECYPFEVYETMKGCEQMQYRKISASFKVDFCHE